MRHQSGGVGVSGWGGWGHLSDRQQRNAFSDKDFSDRCSDIFQATSNSNVGLWKIGSTVLFGKKKYRNKGLPCVTFSHIFCRKRGSFV